MFFVSRDRGQSFFLPQHEYKVIQTDSGSVTVKVPLKQIAFEPFSEGSGGFKTPALPVKYGREAAEGWFDSKYSRMRKNVEQDEAEEFLLSHKMYGIDFVAIGDDGKAIDPLAMETPAKRSERFLSESGDGVHCALCEKQVNKKGLHKHIESHAHMNRLEEAEQHQVRKMSGVA
jgi:hypothetical protein